MNEITVTLTPEQHEALVKAAELAELAELAAIAHADMLNAHAPAAAEERRELGRTFAAARLRLHNVGAPTQPRAAA